MTSTKFGGLFSQVTSFIGDRTLDVQLEAQLNRHFPAGGKVSLVVNMTDLTSPHHRHPNGEIDLIMPLTEGATFGDRPAGWLVYGPNSTHAPTVKGGSALVLYSFPMARSSSLAPR
jgi:uncharacterized protein DUF4863